MVNSDCCLHGCIRNRYRLREAVAHREAEERRRAAKGQANLGAFPIWYGGCPRRLQRSGAQAGGAVVRPPRSVDLRCLGLRRRICCNWGRSAPAGASAAELTHMPGDTENNPSERLESSAGAVLASISALIVLSAVANRIIRRRLPPRA